MQRTVEISNKSFTYSTTWEGNLLGGPVIALDTETTVVEIPEYPTFVLASVSNGKEHYLLNPSNMADFLIVHKDKHFAFQNISFDFWVLHTLFTKQNCTDAITVLWDMIDSLHAHDTMILDMLYRLAINDAYPNMRPLDILSKEYVGLSISKDDPYRLRYGEILDRPFKSVEVGFLDYAIKDTIVTYFLFIELYKKTTMLARRAGISQELIDKFGPLTENIQIKGAIALYKATHNGFKIDQEYCETLYNKLLDHVKECTASLMETPEYSGIFHRHKKTNELLYTKNNAPKTSLTFLRAMLLKEANRISAEGTPVNIPKTEKGNIGTSMKEWEEWENHSEFIKLFADLKNNAKLLEFFKRVHKPRVYPHYTIMVRTGRISAYDINITQLPRKDGIRDIFEASDNHLLVCVDYKFIELRTLAAVTEYMYSSSKMADLIRENKDLHCHTAGILTGMSYEEFLLKEKTDTKFYKKWRQDSKVSNFGLPGGLSAQSLVFYAKTVYKVNLTLEQATAIRNTWINDVYPEMKKYLSENTSKILADNLGCPVYKIYEKFDWNHSRHPQLLSPIKNIVMGKPVKRNGDSYSANYINSVWSGLLELNTNTTLAEPLAKRAAGDELFRSLFWTKTHTLTGRIRGRVSFTQNANCLDAKTEALTKRGWIPGFQLTMDDEILTKNPDTGVLEWQKPTGLHFYPDYEGELIEFKSKTFNVISTLEHRWLADHAKKQERYCITSEKIACLKEPTRINLTGNYIGPIDPHCPDEFVELCGWFLTDGNISIIPRKLTEDYIRVSLFQSLRANPHKVEKIEKILYKLDALGNKQFREDTQLNTYVLKTEFAKALFTEFPDRVLTEEFLLKLTKNQCKVLLETMIDGDGCRSCNREIFCCKSERQKDIFQFLVTLCGYSSWGFIRDMSKYKPKSTKLKNIPNMGTVWYIKIKRRHNTQIGKKESRVFFDKQPVWCPEVPNTYFVARREGRVFISGNTPFQGLAADGAKKSLYTLTKKGYKLVAFVHDELDFELPIIRGPEGRVGVSAKAVDDICKTMCDEMQELTGRVPIAVDYVVSKKWKKDGKSERIRLEDGEEIIIPV
jgi:DNA polymerase I-like protein with 3'-5' exonuclease and polymerase domains